MVGRLNLDGRPMLECFRPLSLRGLGPLIQEVARRVGPADRPTETLRCGGDDCLEVQADERAYEEDRRHWTACAVDTLCLVGLRLKREGR